MRSVVFFLEPHPFGPAARRLCMNHENPMRTVMVRYQVKPDRAAENERYIEAVFAELKDAQPGALRYASFKQSDGVTFVHVASMDAGANPLAALASFKAFSAKIAERCDVPPVVTELSPVGAYRFF
jgi:hypothetical protein